MKLFWKQFIPMTCFTILSFMIFGNLMISNSFQTTMNRETNRSIEEIKIFQYALAASLEGLPKDYQSTDIAVREIVKSIRQSLGNTQSEVLIYDKKQNIVYQNGSYQGKLIQNFRNGNKGIWQIRKEKQHYFLEALCEVPSSAGSYLLEIHQNFDHVYQDRNQLYHIYRLSLFLVSGIFIMVLLIFSIHFTRPIRKLSRAVQSFAKGNYQSRVKVSGHDEVSYLGEDFNQMAGQLEESIEQLEEEARRQEEFTGAFSHELKTPLTSIIGYADMLRSRNLSRKEQLLSADYIFQQGRRLERLAKKMLELSYIDKQNITFQSIDVPTFVIQIENMTRQLLTEKNITFTIQAKEGQLWGEPDLLLSLFSNLIDNARKACPEGGNITLTGKTEIDGYSFAVKDNGQGIPAKEIHKITEPFYMIDKSRARKEGGAGMGMALCQKIVRLHHAEWNIKSTPGKGTTIELYFPVHTQWDNKSQDALRKEYDNNAAK